MAIKRKYTTFNPAVDLIVDKGIVVREKKAISKDEYNLLVNECQSLRSTTIVAFMYYTGVRIGELVEIEVSDVDLVSNKIWIKNSKSNAGNRKIPIDKKLRPLIEFYLEDRRLLDTENNYLFLNRYNKKLPVRTLQLFISNLSKSVGKKFTCHDFRRSFVTNLFHAGFNPKRIQRYVGHESIKTTMEYFIDLDDDYELDI